MRHGFQFFVAGKSIAPIRGRWDDAVKDGEAAAKCVRTGPRTIITHADARMKRFTIRPLTLGEPEPRRLAY